MFEVIDFLGYPLDADEIEEFCDGDSPSLTFDRAGVFIVPRRVEPPLIDPVVVDAA